MNVLVSGADDVDDRGKVQDDFAQGMEVDRVVTVDKARVNL